MTESTPTGTVRAGGFWAILGKLGLIATLLWVVVQLITHFWARDTVLRASGEYASFEVPQKYLDDLRELERMLGPDEQRRRGFPVTLQETLTSARAICRIALLNAGSKQVDDLILEVPFSGVAVVSRIGEPSVYLEFDRKFKVGTLRPSNEVQCVLWSYHSLIDSYDEEKIKFTHSAGVVPVTFSKRLTGIPAWIGANFWSLVFALVPPIVLVLILSSAIWALHGSEVPKTQPEQVCDTAQG